MRLIEIFMFVFMVLPITASADTDVERAALARIVHELEAIKPIIDEAQSQADTDSRVQFQYDWLRLDIQRIQSGITEHLAAPLTQPRTFPPLKGDYRH